MFDKKIYRSDMLRCALCHDAPCTASCGKLDPARLLRSIWFDNEIYAAASLPDKNPCAHCSAPCEAACVRPHQVPIKNIITRLYTQVRPNIEVPLPADETRLRIELCGIPMENPFILASSVISSNYDMCARAFDAGWAGAALKTICSMEIKETSPRYSAVSGPDGSIMGFKNIEQLSRHSVDEDLKIIRNLKEKYPSKFIMASIMGKDEAEWESLARQCQDSGADALELNFSCPNMAESGLGSDIGQVPHLVEHFTAAARRGACIPILAKLTPNVTSMNPTAEAAKRGGADGLAAINTIKSIMGVNPHTYVSSPAVHGMSAVGGYSGNAVKPVALRFIAEMAKNPALKGMHLSAMGGVETWHDALEFLLMGAGSIQVATAVMQYGNRIIDDLKAGLNLYLAAEGLKSVKEAVGQGLDTVSSTTDVLERDSILFPRFDHSKCISCGRCALSCKDGGHLAIRLNDEKKPVLDGKRCVGCHLCILVCPERAISPCNKRIKRG